MKNLLIDEINKYHYKHVKSKSIMSFINKIIHALGHIFTNLYKEAEIAYNEQPAEVKEAMTHGSGVIAVFNQMLSDAPDIVFNAILAEFPDLNAETLETGLFALANKLGITNATSRAEVVVAIQGKLKSEAFGGSAWEWISFSFSGLLSLVFAPPTTKFTTISSLLETVYHKVIKPKIAKSAPTV